MDIKTVWLQSVGESCSQGGQMSLGIGETLTINEIKIVNQVCCATYSYFQESLLLEQFHSV